jgi:hypothetical protein
MLSWLRRIIRSLLSFFARKPQPMNPAPPGPLAGGPGPRQPPRDPLNPTREPHPRRPFAGSAAVAVEEPDEEETRR